MRDQNAVQRGEDWHQQPGERREGRQRQGRSQGQQEDRLHAAPLQQVALPWQHRKHRTFVRLIEIAREGKQVVLDLAEIDLLDGTPVIDIKPYIPYSDRIDEAGDGYTTPLAGPAIEVVFSEEAMEFCSFYEGKTGRRLRELIFETLSLDTRPASHRPRLGDYGMLFWDVNVRWRVEKGVFQVFGCEEKGKEAGE